MKVGPQKFGTLPRNFWNVRPWLEHRDGFESCTDAHDVAWQGERMNGAGVLTGADVACQDGYTNYIGALWEMMLQASCSAVASDMANLVTFVANG
jgi:hypothetical protein